MSGPALLLVGLAVTGSASLASSLLAGIMISAAAGGPVFGVLLDRSGRPGRLLTVALAGYALALAFILLSLGRLPVAVSVLIAVLAGLVGPALSGGWTSQLPRAVPRQALPRANAFDAMTFNLAGLVGPALAGVIAGLFGASASVIVSIALICLALPWAWALPAASAPPAAARAALTRSSVSVAADLAAGFRAIVRSRSLARATVTSVISCVGEGMLVTCSPLIGKQVLGGAGRGVILLSGMAASALAANTVLSRYPRMIRSETIIWSSTVVLATALLLAAVGEPSLLIPAVAMAGAAEGTQLTALFAVRHREAPEDLRGRIFTTGASLKITGSACGAAAAGPIATWSLPGALTAAAGVEILAAVTFAAITLATCQASHRRRRRCRSSGGE